MKLALSFLPLLFLSSVHSFPIPDESLVERAGPSGSKFVGANEIQDLYPSNITGSYDHVAFLIPFPTETVEGLLPIGKKLLPLYSIQKTLPSHVEGSHPVLVKIGMDKDVSSGGLTGSKSFDFSNSHVSIPFVDHSGDGSTGFVYDLLLLSSSPSGIALTLTYSQSIATLATFDPKDQGFKKVEDRQGFYSASATGVTKQKLIYEVEFTKAEDGLEKFSTITVEEIKSIANQGQFQLGLCTYDAQFYNASNSNPHVVVASTLNLYSPFVPPSIAGMFKNVFGIRVPNANFVESISQPCRSEV